MVDPTCIRTRQFVHEFAHFELTLSYTCFAICHIFKKEILHSKYLITMHWKSIQNVMLTSDIISLNNFKVIFAKI